MSALSRFFRKPGAAARAQPPEAAQPAPAAHPAWVAYEPALVPSLERMRIEGIEVLEEWFRWAEEWSMILRVYGALTRTSAVLEIGCGQGRIAFPLRYLLTKDGSYHGFDIDRQKIAALETFHRAHPNFTFQFVDVHNSFYNPTGVLRGDTFRFPYADGSFDVIYAASVFTHMAPQVAANYFHEAARVLTPGGRCIFSVFLLDYYRPGAVRSLGFTHPRFNFDHPYGSFDQREFAIANPKNHEEMTAYSQCLIERLAADAGLKLQQPIVPGQWSGSTKTWVGAQDLVILERAKGPVASVASAGASQAREMTHIAAGPTQAIAPVQVSVIIPAHNAAATLAQTLESLQAQLFVAWEAIVVDDGSTDGTLAVAEEFATRDARIRAVGRPHAGVSAARNAGLASARHDWLLFLDADDWVSPHHLERLTMELQADPGLDLVHCRVAYVSADGAVFEEPYQTAWQDPFQKLAKTCAFPIHACLVRRALVDELGGFDASLRTCEDWDLWQRIARTGARFGHVPEVLAFYRMRPHSASTHGRRMLEGGLRVIARGHAPDPRVRRPHPAYAGGMPPREAPATQLYLLCYTAGLALAGEEDALALLELVESARNTALDPEGIARTLFNAVLIPLGLAPVGWQRVYPTLAHRIQEFLQGLEALSNTPGLARCARTTLERLILEHAAGPWPLTIGAMHAVRIEVTESISEVRPPSSVERLLCLIDVEGARIGTLELPVCDGLVPHDVLADAITAKFAWPILGRFFERTLYPSLTVTSGASGNTIWRGDVCLGDVSSSSSPAAGGVPHDRIGWTVLLQELWGRPDWPAGRFYEPDPAPDAGKPCRVAENGTCEVEISEALSGVEASGEGVGVIPLVGGVPLGILTLRADTRRVSAADVRAAINSQVGFELCRAAVREGVLERPLAADPLALRQRLSRAAAARLRQRAASAGHNGHEILLGRRTPELFDASASRRAQLPVAAATDLMDGAATAGEPVTPPAAGFTGLRAIRYVPELFDVAVPSRKLVSTPSSAPARLDARAPEERGREYFERLFASTNDPWSYTSPYEQTKYEQTLALLPHVPLPRALELACAEGHFTAQLAPRVGRLTASDISEIALQRAAQRCRELPQVEFRQLDLAHDPLPGRFNLIVCSEVLYYMGNREQLEAVARKFADALEPDGYLLTAHAHLVVDEPDRAGFDWNLPFGVKVIGDVLASTPRLRLLRELRTPLYRIQLFQKTSGDGQPTAAAAPEMLETTDMGALRSESEATVRWQGGRPTVESVPVRATDELPVLMYHRISPSGAAGTERYRVSPENFERQLRYLADNGYYSVVLDDWAAAMRARRPLPGRAVCLTFDDGYRDFQTHAWPLLKRYGFTATVFLVTEEVGGSNRWDRTRGDAVPLMTWDDIRALRAEGAVFGSHSATHPPLAGLRPEETVRELVRSRTQLERELREPVRTIAYPYGLTDEVVEHLAGACGYLYGVTCADRLAALTDHPLAISRIEIGGMDQIEDFMRKLSAD